MSLGTRRPLDPDGMNSCAALCWCGRDDLPRCAADSGSFGVVRGTRRARSRLVSSAGVWADTVPACSFLTWRVRPVHHVRGV